MATEDNKPAEDKNDKLAELEKQLSSQSEKQPTTKKSTTAAPRKTVKPASTPVVSEKKATNGFLWTVTVLNFLLIISVAGGGVWFWQQWQAQQSDQATFLQQQNSAIAIQTQQNDAVKAQLAEQQQAVQNSLQSMVEQLQITAQQVQKNSTDLADVSGRRPSDWLLAEADYLVRMAGRKLWLEKDVKTAILMLQSADSRLQDLADPSLLPVRELLAADIQSLSQINDISLSSVALSVSGLVQQVNGLALALPEIPDIVKNEAQVTDSVSDWRANLDQLWRFFKENLISYQPRNQPIRPLLTSQQQWLAKEQLKLALLQAQSAVLAEQPQLFTQAMQQAKDLLNDHFDLANSNVDQFSQSVENLVDVNVIRQYPSELRSALPLKDLLQKRIDSAFVNGASTL